MNTIKNSDQKMIDSLNDDYGIPVEIDFRAGNSFYITINGQAPIHIATIKILRTCLAFALDAAATMNGDHKDTWWVFYNEDLGAYLAVLDSDAARIEKLDNHPDYTWARNVEAYSETEALNKVRTEAAEAQLCRASEQAIERASGYRS
jgi:hypothetical protein